jgi:hypothetical protein
LPWPEFVLKSSKFSGFLRIGTIYVSLIENARYIVGSGPQRAIDFDIGKATALKGFTKLFAGERDLVSSVIWRLGVGKLETNYLRGGKLIEVAWREARLELWKCMIAVGLDRVDNKCGNHTLKRFYESLYHLYSLGGRGEGEEGREGC